MDWAILLLVFILIALWSIHSLLKTIGQSLLNIKMPYIPQPPSLSEVEEKLDYIFQILGGEDKMKTQKDKQRKELKIRLIQIFTKQGKTQKQAEGEVDRLFEEAEFSEKHEDYNSDSLDFDGLEQWAKEFEIEERYQKKYGHLLEKARDYFKDKNLIPPNEMKLKEALETDYYGEEWLIEKLIEEKRLKKNTEYRLYQPDELINYEVIQS